MWSNAFHLVPLGAGGFEAACMLIMGVLLAITIFKWEWMAQMRGMRAFVKQMGSRSSRIFCLLALVALFALSLKLFISATSSSVTYYDVESSTEATTKDDLETNQSTKQ